MEQTEEKVIDIVERCDSCNAQAYFMAIFESGELYFCRHHFMKNEEAITDIAYHIVDQSETLVG
jgi:hypothetical protein